ncbi:hypothetical protein KPH14_009612 [Odynerus spinipes]|uniref:Uncharacterized protein n=1 Tax=Odynerus spinipes TaxID=1348599 RepID=A0AAD9RQY2_9HYME|nr:hypothetical protein KPH14_009612 [Odynerus spinipes]
MLNPRIRCLALNVSYSTKPITAVYREIWPIRVQYFYINIEKVGWFPLNDATCETTVDEYSNFLSSSLCFNVGHTDANCLDVKCCFPDNIVC